MNKRNIIIDTDPGVDDFFCLMMAKAFEGEVFTIRGLTTVCGNNTAQVCTQNALGMAKLLQIDAPVSMGAGQYLLAPYGQPVVSAHGHNGMGEATVPKSSKQPHPLPAWDFIYQEAVALDGQLELVPVGPLTNIAIALLKYPDLKHKIKGITIMGGGTLVGNMSPYGEANVAHDPHAADVVFKSGIPMTMVGLNVTEKCAVSLESALPYMGNMTNTLKEACKTMLNFRAGEALHDAIAVGLMIRPEIATYEHRYVEIETGFGLSYGQTAVDFAGLSEKAPYTQVAMEIDSAQYQQLFCEMLQRVNGRGDN